jgi:hypothetical protein
VQIAEEVVKLEGHADYRHGVSKASQEVEERRKERAAAKARIPGQANDPPQQTQQPITALKSTRQVP